VSQEDGTRVNRVVGVARTGPGRRPAAGLPGRRRQGCRLTAATASTAGRRQRRPLGGTNAAVTNVRRFA